MADGDDQTPYLPQNIGYGPKSGATPPSPQDVALNYYATLAPQTPTRLGIPLGPLTQLIGRYESGGNYDRLASTPPEQSNATSLPVGPTGFPQWEGAKNVYGATSHGAGVAQFEPSLWDEASAAMGLKDFSPFSQNAALNWSIMRYGGFPWHWNRNLQQAMGYYRSTGRMPPPGFAGS